MISSAPRSPATEGTDLRAFLIVRNLKGGGAERAMINIASGLAGRGHEVHLVLLEQAVAYPPPQDIPLHTLIPRTIGKGRPDKLAVASELRRLYRDLTRATPFDLAVSTLPFTDKIVRMARLPRVWFRIANDLSAEIGALSESRGRLVAALRRSNYRRLYAGQRLIAVSRGVAESLRTGLDLRPKAIETVYNPFDFGAILRRAAEPEPDLPREPYILHVGRHAPQKRHDLLFDAFRLAGLPHRLVLLSGDTRTLTALVAAAGLADRVSVAGFRENPYPWFRHAAATVLASDREGMPNVLVESLICGTPVVSTDCPSGPREVLTGGMSRWLVPVGDAAALAARLGEAVAGGRPEVESGLLAPFSRDAALDALERLAERG